MILREEEQEILNGARGRVLQRIMQSIVLYGEAVGADDLAPIEGAGHFSISAPGDGLDLPRHISDAIVDAGLTTTFPFTLDPDSPLNFDEFDVDDDEKQELTSLYASTGAYRDAMLKMGLRDVEAMTCTPYTYENGNVPVFGQVIAWSESSAVVYANSVLGARTNRNAAIMDLFVNIIGKTPRFGLLLDEGRKASWRISIETNALPHPQLLGTLVGRKVVADTPYLVGLKRFLGEELNGATLDWLKEFGAACAALGAVGLYHVEGLTPEAKQHGDQLLHADAASLVVDDDMMATLQPKPDTDSPAPERCLIGCPHLSLREINWWVEELEAALDVAERKVLAVPTTLMAAPGVLDDLRSSTDLEARLTQIGAKLSPSCCEMVLSSSAARKRATVTNSSKLQAFTRSRMIPDGALINVLVNGRESVQ